MWSKNSGFSIMYLLNGPKGVLKLPKVSLLSPELVGLVLSMVQSIYTAISDDLGCL